MILELKLPPADAYLKIKHTLEEINGLIFQHASHLPNKENMTVSPILGNVIFMSCQYGSIFSLKSYAKMYSQRFGGINPDDFVKVLWGDYYYDASKRKFLNSPSKDFNVRAFVQFILEPIYKIISHTVSHEYDKLQVIYED